MKPGSCNPILLLVLIVLSSGRVRGQVADGFETDAGAWTITGNKSLVQVSNVKPLRGAGCLELGKNTGITQTLKFSGLQLVSAHAFARAIHENDSIGLSLVFLDSAYREVLRLTSVTVLDTSYRHFGYYTLSPPGTSYLRIAINRGADEGPVYLDSLVINTRIEKYSPQLSTLNTEQYLRPFWKTDTVYNETVLMYADSGKQAAGRLIYMPEKIISVKSFDGKIRYHLNKDYSFTGRKIKSSAESDMPVVADTFFEKHNAAWYDIQSKWVVITYTTKEKWKGPTPVFRGKGLPLSLARLQDRKPLKIVAYGMSITRGMNVSGYDSVAPFMPTYTDLFVAQLGKKYQHPAIQFSNAALPGSTADWGATYAANYVNPLRPDLVLLDFGMNDFWRVSPEEFRTKISQMISTIRKGNTRTEFILIANLGFDPAFILKSDTNRVRYQSNFDGYARALEELQAPGIVCLNMNSLSKYIYLRKSPRDCLANPLHPNDYMARWYAQALSALLIP